MIVRVLALAALAAAVSVGAASAARGPAVTVTVAHASFPDRALVLTLPHSAPLASTGVQVYENGRRVEPLSVTGRDTKAIGFVLAIDESASMRGAPLAEALRAAQAFAERRQEAQSLGVVAFNAEATTVLQPTTNGESVSAALAQPPSVASGTRLWDGVVRSIGMLHDSGVAAGSVVVLSDGRDTASKATPEQVVARARAAAVRIFTVGLRSPQFDPAALRAVATATGGTYAETSSQGLVAVYDALGARLANEYVLDYRSTAPRGSTVHVTVAVPAFGRVAGAAAVTYLAPLPSGGGVLHRPAADRFVVSRVSVAAIVGSAALLAAVAVVLAMRAIRNRPLAHRLQRYGLGSRRPAPQAAAEDRPGPIARSLRGSRWWTSFEHDLDVGRVPYPARRLALLAATGAALLLAVAAAAHAPWLAVLAVVPPIVVRWYAAHRAEAMRRAFEAQLPDTLQVLASALRAGHGMTHAIRMAVDDAQQPVRGELDRAVADEQLGVPLDEALGVVADRMRCVDLEHVAFVTGVHRQTGGNTAEVLDRVHDAIRERFELRRTVRTLTAQARMTRWILVLLPAGLALVITLLNREYMQPLVATNAGRAVIALAVLMVVSGFLLIKRLTEIKV